MTQEEITKLRATALTYGLSPSTAEKLLNEIERLHEEIRSRDDQFEWAENSIEDRDTQIAMLDEELQAVRESRDRYVQVIRVKDRVIEDVVKDREERDAQIILLNEERDRYKALLVRIACGTDSNFDYTNPRNHGDWCCEAASVLENLSGEKND
jgi:uncharacterized coiled-coil DUF342 family protein